MARTNPDSEYAPASPTPTAMMRAPLASSMARRSYALPNRRFTRPVALRHALADDSHSRPIGAIAFGEGAAPLKCSESVFGVS
jgi:hypothetical protein